MKLKSSLNFEENVELVEGISPHIVTTSIKDDYNCLHSFKTNSDKSVNNADIMMSDRNNHRNYHRNNNNHNSSNHPNLESYCRANLSSLEGRRYYTPYKIGTFLYKHEINDVRLGSKRISKHNLMVTLMKMDVVPIRKTALYRLVDLCRAECLSPDDIWTNITHPGKKPFLSCMGFNLIVRSVREKSNGGLAIAFSKLKKIVKSRIIFEMQLKRKDNFIPKISDGTLNDYASRIMSQNIFNINVGKIPYKTETRSTAEWSFRSTISFALVNAITHFLPDTEPSDYHRRKSEIPAESLVLWDLVESCYSRLFGSSTGSSRKVKCIPVLPNLVTSTDELTIFACPGKISEFIS